MRHGVKKKRFDRHTSHRLAMFRNMVTSLIEEERIATTLEKAKVLRQYADRMVTLAKNGTLHARRKAASFVRGNKAVQKLFADLGPRFATRNGGYTRVLKLGNRHGDGSKMAFIEFLGFQPKVKVKPTEKKKKQEKEATPS